MLFPSTQNHKIFHSEKRRKIKGNFKVKYS
jgi:hypothetical protein